jgi:hypothetical protein
VGYDVGDYLSAMRISFFLFFFLAAMPGKLFAQSPVDRLVEVSIGWSVADRIGYEDDFTYSLPYAVRAPIFPGKDARHTGCITGGFMLNIGRGWSIGLAVATPSLRYPALRFIAGRASRTRGGMFSPTRCWPSKQGRFISRGSACAAMHDSALAARIANTTSSTKAVRNVREMTGLAQ